MELTPQDIGKDRYLAVMRRRLTHSFHNHADGSSGIDNVDQPLLRPVARRRTRRLRRYWVRGLKVDEKTAENLSEAAWSGSAFAGPRVAFAILSLYVVIAFTLFGFLHNDIPLAIPMSLLFLWLVAAYGVAIRPRIAIRKIHNTAVTTGEVDRMLPTARGRLERSYLNLIHEVIQQDIPSASAQVNIRSAMRDLGDTISRLPAEAVPTHDADALRLEAQEQRVKAQYESDAFVQTSLLRQAAALDRRADLAGQNSSAARRARALRQEARSQIDALRAVLLAFQQTSEGDAATIAHLSEAVQHVSQEAQAATVARRELEEDEISHLLGKPLPANLPPQPILQARKIIDPIATATQPQTQPTPEPAVQVLQAGRPWWRGQ